MGTVRNAPFGRAFPFPLMSTDPKSAADLRSLAALLRGHAVETGLDMYRRKFESLARELEEAARDAETRARNGKKPKPDS